MSGNVFSASIIINFPLGISFPAHAVPVFTEMETATCHRFSMRAKSFRFCDDSHILERLVTSVYRESIAALNLI